MWNFMKSIIKSISLCISCLNFGKSFLVQHETCLILCACDMVLLSHSHFKWCQFWGDTMYKANMLLNTFTTLYQIWFATKSSHKVHDLANLLLLWQEVFHWHLEVLSKCAVIKAKQSNFGQSIVHLTKKNSSAERVSPFFKKGLPFYQITIEKASSEDQKEISCSHWNSQRELNWGRGKTKKACKIINCKQVKKYPERI